MEKFRRVGDYLIDTSKSLGKGSFGIVYLGYHSTTSMRVAAKIINQTSINASPKKSKLIESLTREVAILQTASHPNIVRLLHQYITSNNYYLIFEYCEDGDLATYRLKNSNNGYLTEQEALTFLKNIISGLMHLHSLHIIHRDLKPSNILLKSSVLKIADFGLSRFCEEVKQFMTQVGTPFYMAPEVYETGLYGKSCDIWSLGILFFELLYGNVPWKSRTREELMDEVKKEIKFPENPRRDERLKDLIRRMLVYDMDKRISLEELSNFESLTFNGFGKMQKENILEESLCTSMLTNGIQLGKRLVQGNLAEELPNTGEQHERRKKTIGEKEEGKRELHAMEEGGRKEDGGNRKEEELKGTRMEEERIKEEERGRMEEEVVREGGWEEQVRKDIRRESSNVRRESGLTVIAYGDAGRKKENERVVKEKVLFQRNVAFFIKAACQTLVECYGSGKLEIAEDFLYQIVFTLQKHIVLKMRYHVLDLFSELGGEKKEEVGVGGGRKQEEEWGMRGGREEERREMELLKEVMERDYRDCYIIYDQLDKLVTSREEVWKKKKNWGAFQIVMKIPSLHSDFLFAYNEIMKEWKEFAKKNYKSKKSFDREYLRTLLFMGICNKFNGVEKFFVGTGAGDKENIFYKFYEEVGYFSEKEMKKRIEAKFKEK